MKSFSESKIGNFSKEDEKATLQQLESLLKTKSKGDNVMRYRIRLETYSDVMRFVGKAENFGKPLLLTDGNKYCVNAKSLLGCLATIEWNNIFIESESESPQIYSTFEEFIY